jgi:hypothetical protein
LVSNGYPFGLHEHSRQELNWLIDQVQTCRFEVFPAPRDAIALCRWGAGYWFNLIWPTETA